MMKLALLALLVVYLSGVNGKCIRHGVRCLEYTVLQTHEGYEERVYSPITWVSASAEAKRKMDVSSSLMKLLYAYLDGANDRKERLSMMLPVRTLKIVMKDRNFYKMSLPLLHEQSENPPSPSDPSVSVRHESSYLYVVRSFGGHHTPTEHMWDNNARILREAVAHDETVDPYHGRLYFMATYDWNATGRLNEVWMVKYSLNDQD